jgi:hypothetical protein
VRGSGQLASGMSDRVFASVITQFIDRLAHSIPSACFFLTSSHARLAGLLTRGRSEVQQFKIQMPAVGKLKGVRIVKKKKERKREKRKKERKKKPQLIFNVGWFSLDAISQAESICRPRC